MRYINHQKYWECQFVTAVNAALYFNEPGIHPESVEYERWIDFMRGARDEGIWNIKPAYKYLGLGFKRIPIKINCIMDSIDNGHPVELSFHSNMHGIHSALAIDYNHEAVRVLNNGFSLSSWVPWKFMLKRIKEGSKVAEQHAIDTDDFKKGLKAFYMKDPYDVVFEMED